MRPELQDIVDEASRLLQADTTLEDTAFNLIAYGTQHSDVDQVRSDSILRRRSTSPVREWFEQFGITTSSDPLRTPADLDQDLRTRLCFPARWRGLTYGYLWVLDDSTELTAPVVGQVARLAAEAAGYLAQLSREREDEAFAVADLTAADPTLAQQAATRIVDRGLMEPRTPVVAVVVVTAGAELPGIPAPNLWRLPRPVVAGRTNNATVLIVPLRRVDDDTAATEVAAAALTLYRGELPVGWEGRVLAGIGQPVRRLEDVRSSWLDARLAARVATVVPDLGPVARWADLGLYRLLATAPPDELRPVVLDPPVRRLLDASEPDLVQTLTAYLDRAGNAHETAAALHIHRQTLYYRLGKVEGLTGLNLADGHDRTRLHVGLLLAPVLDSD